MKFFLIIFLFVHSALYALHQAPARNEVDTLLLGNFDERGYGALVNGELLRLPASSAGILYTVEPAYLLEQLEQGRLAFHAYGDADGAWEAFLSGKELKFTSYTNDAGEETISLSYGCDHLPGVTIMFSGSNGWSGLIKAVAYQRTNKQEIDACVYAINDEEMLFEVYINKGGKILKGCGAFEKAE